MFCLFDEPTGVSLVVNSETVLSIHECSGAEGVVYLGGLNTALKNRIDNALTQAGFQTSEHPDPNLHGGFSTNICNRGLSGRGVQLEITRGLRKAMFEDLNNSMGRKTKQLAFDEFTIAIRKALSNEA